MKKYKMTFDNLRDVLCVLDRQGCDACPLKGKAAKTESCYAYCQAHPEEAIALIGLEVVEVEDKPRLTEQELTICKALGAKWVSIDDDGGDAELWGEEPFKENGNYFIGYPPTPFGLARIASGLFPSLKAGDCVNVEELLNEMS